MNKSLVFEMAEALTHEVTVSDLRCVQLWNAGGFTMTMVDGTQFDVTIKEVMRETNKYEQPKAGMRKLWWGVYGRLAHA